jgi:L,D-peptidoglycan transpeptidase YkuD (ErfK/YbiS/YcfS/YnhG family)
MYNIRTMIIVKQSGHLIFKKLVFKCTFGVNGISSKKIEGDKITPIGKYSLLKVYYRSDRIKNLKTKLKKIIIKKNMGWCDDPKSELYNKEIRTPNIFNYEKLYRKDKIYDLIVVLNYNSKPVIKNKGSAIFIHIAKQKFKSTEGCIALKRNDLIKLLSLIEKNEKIRIEGS